MGTFPRAGAFHRAYIVDFGGNRCGKYFLGSRVEEAASIAVPGGNRLDKNLSFQGLCGISYPRGNRHHRATAPRPLLAFPAKRTAWMQKKEFQIRVAPATRQCVARCPRDASLIKVDFPSCARGTLIPLSSQIHINANHGNYPPCASTAGNEGPPTER